MRKYHLVAVVALVGAIIACSMVKTRSEVNEEAKTQSVTENLPTGPIVADNEAADAAETVATEAPIPPDDPVLNEELEKMAVDAKDAKAVPSAEAAPVKTRPAFKQTPTAKVAPIKTKAKVTAKKKSSHAKVTKVAKAKKPVKKPLKKKKKVKEQDA